MDEDLDSYGFPRDPAERMQQMMLRFYDLSQEARDAGFPIELTGRFEQLRLEFVNEFERQNPGYGKGRAVWR